MRAEVKTELDQSTDIWKKAMAFLEKEIASTRESFISSQKELSEYKAYVERKFEETLVK